MKKINYYSGKIIFLAFLLLFLLDITPLRSAHPRSAYHKEHVLKTKYASMKTAISRLQALPESKRIIQQALKNGSITVEKSCFKMSSEAMWDNALRKIVIDGRSSQDQGRLLCHILFELMNAISEPQYDELYMMAVHGSIDCDSYVEAVERIEYANLIRASAIIEKGINTGVFLQSGRWEIIDDFAVHYKIQQLAGHSLSIVREYQQISSRKSVSPYRGTVKNLKRMSQREKMSRIEALYRNYLLAS